MPLVYLVSIAALAIAVAVFALQNADRVTVSFLTWKLEGAPLAAVILVSGALGALLVSLVGLLQRWKLRAQIRQLESRLKASDQAATRATRAGAPRNVEEPRA